MNVENAAKFLASFCHRDLGTELADIRNAVRSFVHSEEGRESAWMVASQLDLIADQRIYAADDEWLHRVYGCDYSPNQKGMDASNWIRNVAALMKDELPR